MLDHKQHQEIRFEPSPEGKNNEGHGVLGPFLPLSFKLGMEADSGRSISNAYSCNEEEGEIRGGQEDALIRGSERYCTQARQTSLAVSRCWQNQEDSAIKQPFWKPLSTEISNGNNNNNIEREKNTQEEDQKIYRPPKEIHNHQQIIKSLEENNKSRVVFGELEAIYADNTNADIHRIASESVLTAEDLQTSHNVSFPVMAFNDSNQASGATTAMATTAAGIDIGSESASVGGREADAEATRGEVHKRKRAKESRTSTSVSRFFESLVKKLANHQEDLQKRFMQTIERLDQERKEREEAWREQQLAKLQHEAAVRAHEKSLASSREATLVSYLEKLTGQKISFQPIKNEDKSCYSYMKLNNKKWPQAEVDALIQIRTSLESKFREPGPKGILWEELSNSMASMGFQRSARRCKEKWENMHKCSVKRTKDVTWEQFNNSTATVEFVNQGNDTVDHLAIVNLPEGNADEKDKHANVEYKIGSGKEDMEELKE
ncbi:unnamed protein product [Withania somnifera]